MCGAIVAHIEAGNGNEPKEDSGIWDTAEDLWQAMRRRWTDGNSQSNRPWQVTGCDAARRDQMRDCTRCEMISAGRETIPPDDAANRGLAARPAADDQGEDRSK